MHQNRHYQVPLLEEGDKTALLDFFHQKLPPKVALAAQPPTRRKVTDKSQDTFKR